MINPYKNIFLFRQTRRLAVLCCIANKVSAAPLQYCSQRSAVGEAGFRGWTDTRGRLLSGAIRPPKQSPAACNEREPRSEARMPRELPVRLERPFGRSPERRRNGDAKHLVPCYPKESRRRGKNAKDLVRTASLLGKLQFQIFFLLC